MFVYAILISAYSIMRTNVIRTLTAAVQRKRTEAIKAEDALVSEIMLSPAIDLARAIRVSPQHICDIRHGRRRIGAKVLEKLGGL